MAWKNQDITEIIEEEEITQQNMDKYDPLNQVYFAFIDVLGFKQYYDDMKKSGTNVMPPYVDVFSYFFDLTNAIFGKSEKDSYYAGQTSDTLYFYTSRPDYMMKFIRLYSAFSLYAMAKDVFFRGGIASGGLWTKMQHQFFGDSVIKAFYLEENISKNPIVLIDNATNEALKNEPDYNELVHSESERFFVKPFALWNTCEELDIEDKSIIKSVDREMIRNNIYKNIERFEYNDKNRSKYLYLRDRLPVVNDDKEIGA